MTAQRRTGCGGQLQVDKRTRHKLRERGARDGLRGKVGREAWRKCTRLDGQRSKADPADGDTVAQMQPLDDPGAATVSRDAPAVGVNAITSPVVSTSPVNIALA